MICGALSMLGESCSGLVGPAFTIKAQSDKGTELKRIDIRTGLVRGFDDKIGIDGVDLDMLRLRILVIRRLRR